MVEYYFSQLQLVDQYLINKSKKLYNEVLPFIQFYIGYNVLFRIISPAYKFLNNKDLNSYCIAIENQLKQIDDKYILEQKFASYKTKLFALSLKYKRDVRYDIIQKNNLFIYSGKILINLSKRNKIIIWNNLNFEGNALQLEGKDNFWFPKNIYYYYCRFANNTFFPSYKYYSGFDFYTMYGLSDKGRMINFNIPIGENNGQSLKFFISYKGKEIEIFPSLGKFTHISKIKNGYYSNGKYIIKLKKKRIIIYQYNKILEKSFELKFCKELKKLQKQKIVDLRKNYFKFKKRNNNHNNTKEIWLINDKPNKAGDNGEYFFRFLMKKNFNNIKAYFVIKKTSYDYQRLKHFVNIIDLDSAEYLNKFLKADKIISSEYGSWVTNPFGNDINFIKDLLHFNIIYIQNGIIADDMSKYLNKIDNNFNLFITSSKKEYKSILSSKYYFNKNNVVLTGLPKFDNLFELSKIKSKEKLILIIPNYRIYLKETIDFMHFKSIYSDNFKYTSFFRFYNSLINNHKILLNMEKYNFSGQFCLHPYFSEQINDFTKNNFFKIENNCNYQEILIKSSLLVTD